MPVYIRGAYLGLLYSFVTYKPTLEPIMPATAIRIFQIDTHNDQVIPVDKDQYGKDFEDYLTGLIDIISEGSGRSFIFERDTTEIRTLIPKIISGEEFSVVSQIAAQRLLSCEKNTQQTIQKLGKEIQKGIVVQAIIQENNSFRYVICKADHSEFLKDGDYTKTKGLPTKKKVFKAFYANFDSTGTVDNVIVYDTNSIMSKYWWSDFLELTEVYTDKHNTITAFEAIDKGVLTKMKKDAPQDYIHLRNSMVRYFRAHDAFDMQDFLDNAIGDYEPYSGKLKVDTVKNSIKELSKTKKFDEQFNIVKEHVTARFLNKIQLTKQIDLHLKEDINDIDNVITAEEGKDGTKYVKIRSDSGYKYFNDLSKKSKK